jgi:hypothetical protein
MLKYIMMVLNLYVVVHTYGQPSEEDKQKLFAILFPEYKYDASSETFAAGDDRTYTFRQTEFTELEGKTLLVVWLQGDESTDRFNQLHLFEYEKQKKKFVIKHHSLILERWITELTVNTITISANKDAIEITGGYDSDGEGDEITYSLFAYLEGTISNILEHTLRSDSGDGCEGEDMESSINLSDEVTDGFKNFAVEETTSTFNDCDENAQENCTKTSRYMYVWSGSGYQRSN